jgi:hypothetical protein
MRRSVAPFLVIVAALATSAALADILVSNCQDVNTCHPSTCSKLYSVKEGACTSLGSSNNSLIDAAYAKFYCMGSVRSCSPTKVYFNDSTCAGAPAETLWTPCGTCLQFPPRLQTCEVSNDTFLVRVRSCHDNSCEQCDPFDNAGLPPATCYAHPGVPGLYLEYENLEACSGVLIEGYSNADCISTPSAQTIMPGQSKCFGGISLSCSSP